MTDDDEWQQAETTFAHWRNQGHSVDEFIQAIIVQQYQQDFPQLSAAETELWERAIGIGVNSGAETVQLPTLVRLRLQGFTWHQAIGCLPGLWISRPEDTAEIERLTYQLRCREDTIAAGMRAPKEHDGR